MNRKHTVFVIDDSYVFRSLVKKTLHSQNYEVVKEATNGEEALIRFKECKPDVVLVDTKMPGMDGFDVIKELKKENPNQRIIAVLLDNSIETKEKAFKCGASELIFKPFQPAFLFTKLESLLSQEALTEADAILDVPGIATQIQKDTVIEPAVLLTQSQSKNVTFNEDIDEDYGELVITIANSVQNNNEIIEIITPDDQFVFNEEINEINESLSETAFNKLKTPDYFDNSQTPDKTINHIAEAKGDDIVVSIRKPQSYRNKLLEEDASNNTLSPPDVFPKDNKLNINESGNENNVFNKFKKLLNLNTKGGK